MRLRLRMGRQNMAGERPFRIHRRASVSSRSVGGLHLSSARSSARPRLGDLGAVAVDGAGPSRCDESDGVAERAPRAAGERDQLVAKAVVCTAGKLPIAFVHTQLPGAHADRGVAADQSRHARCRDGSLPAGRLRWVTEFAHSFSTRLTPHFETP